jgi:hypothetical protein
VRRWFDQRQVRELAEGCDHALAQMRAASRAIGHTTTHISGFLIPEHFCSRPDALARLVEFVSSPAVLTLVCDLGRPLEAELNLRDIQYFHEPTGRDYDGLWHRDGDVPGVAEDEAAANRGTLLRYRVALAADDHLEYVPGSHVRADTQDELRLRRGPVRNAPLRSGSERIALDAGDVCVFDTWGIHRGRYRSATVRRTLDLLFGFGARKSSRTAVNELWQRLGAGQLGHRRGR